MCVKCICPPHRFDFSSDLHDKLQTPAEVVSVFDKVQMQGDKGAVAAVQLPPGDVLRVCVCLCVCDMGVLNVVCRCRLVGL